MENEIKTAEELGKKAFEEGKAAVPAHDKDLMEIIRKRKGPVGSSTPIFKAWSKGWHEANVKAPVEAATECTHDDVYLRGEEPMTCPDCGARSEFKELPDGCQEHTCPDCGKVFITQEEDEEDKETFSSEGMEKNTKISYMYRDGANYKTPAEIILKGVLPKAAMEKLKQVEHFLPSKVGMPSVSPEEDSSDFDDAYDHPFHEITGVERTNEEPDSDLNVKEVYHQIVETDWETEAAVTATGEPDQDYNHEAFDSIVTALEKHGYESSHKEFDKYQGVYLKIEKAGNPLVTLWVKDYFVRGEPTQNPNIKWKSVILYNDAEDQAYSANPGDYFQMGPEDSFPEGTSLVMEPIGGGEPTVIDQPKKKDLPNDSEVQKGISFEGTPSDIFIFSPEWDETLSIEVEINPEGNADVSELVEYLKNIDESYGN